MQFAACKMFDCTGDGSERRLGHLPRISRADSIFNGFCWRPPFVVLCNSQVLLERFPACSPFPRRWFSFMAPSLSTLPSPFTSATERRRDNIGMVPGGWGSGACGLQFPETGVHAARLRSSVSDMQLGCAARAVRFRGHKHALCFGG